MSIFKTKAIILKTFKTNEKKLIYSIFTSDFGKIIVEKKINKKEKNIDIWYCINCEISWNKYYKIRNIKIINEFNTKNKTYKTIELYLQMLYYIYSKTPEKLAIYEIVDIVKQINSYSKEDLDTKIILAILKIKNILWELKIDNKNILINKILKFIDKNNFYNILKLSNISSQTKKDLYKLI